MFVTIAYYLIALQLFLDNIQCTKTIVNGCDALVSIISNFQSIKTFQCIILYRPQLSTG